MRIFTTLVIAVLAVSFSAQAQQTPILTKVLEDVRASYNKQERPLVLFDLDGTLFDNRARTAQILREYADKELKTVRPEAAAKLASVATPLIGYMLTDTLTALGVTEAAVVNNAAVFWSQRFFNDDYLRYDETTPGSIDFVRTLYSNGARIVYLSGRDVPRQLMGTVKALRDKGYPIGIQGTELIMKPLQQTQDAVFKQQVTNYLRHYGKVIASFDSEAMNANMFRRAFPDATVVLFDAPHAPNPPPLLPNIGTIKVFQ